jgi:hypothetical protein
MILPGDAPENGLTLRNLATRENREGLDIGVIVELLKKEGGA